MWEKEVGTVATASGDQAGTMSMWSYGMSTSKVVVELDSSSNQLRLTLVSGDYVLSSEWLAISEKLELADMEPLIRTAAKHLQVLASLRSNARSNGLKPLELGCLMLKTFDHLLA